MNVVVTSSRSKEGWLQLRIDPDFKREVKVVADARGLSISALVHSLLKQAVREEQEQYPQAFKTAIQEQGKVVARIEPAHKTEEEMRADEIRRQLQEGRMIPLATSSRHKIPLINPNKDEQQPHKIKRKA